MGRSVRLILFGVQLVSYIALWRTKHLTVEAAAYTMVVAVTASMVLSLIAVCRELKPDGNQSSTDLSMTLRYGSATIQACG